MADDDDDVRDPYTGQFKPGHKPTGGRPKGSRDKTPAEIRDWYFASAEAIGSDGKGTGGGQGFVEAYSREQKDALYNGMLKLTRPATKTEVEINVSGPPLQVIIASVPRGCFFTKEQADYIKEHNALPPGFTTEQATAIAAPPTLVIDHDEASPSADVLEPDDDEPPTA